jgi:hypothetical protein
MQEQEEIVIIRFFVPKSWQRRAYSLGKGHGIISELGRSGFIRALEEEERRNQQQTEQEQKAS